MRAGHHVGQWMMAAALATVVGCFRAPPPAAATTQLHAEAEPTALVAPLAPPQHAVIAKGDKQTLWVGGCNTACVDCSLAGYHTFVIGKLTRTGAQLFPSPDPPAPGYSCGAEVAIGERVTLVAHSPTEHMTIESWTPFFATDSCPCEGTRSMSCTFTVTAEIASHYDRIYCGAAWKQHATAQIGH